MPSFMVKFWGLTSILAGALLAIAHTTNYLAGGEGTVAGKTMVFAAHLLLVFTFTAIYEKQGLKNGWLGVAGMILGITGTIAVTAVVFVEMASVAGVNVEQIFSAPVNYAIYAFGPLLFVLGMIFVGISIMKNHILPRWGGLLLLIGTLVFAAGTLMGGLEAMVTTIGSLLTGLGFLGIGFSMTKTNHVKLEAVALLFEEK